MTPAPDTERNALGIAAAILLAVCACLSILGWIL